MGLFLRRLLIFFFFIQTLTNCQTSQHHKEAKFPLKKAKQLTWVGVNTSPSFASDGEQIVFTSSMRKSHKDGQIYTMGKNQESEKRLTFNKGRSDFPLIHPEKNQTYFYVSDTNNRKNMDQLILKYKRKFNLSKKEKKEQTSLSKELGLMDIYSSELNGQKVKRHTFNKRFTGFLSFHPNGNSLVFSQQKKGSIHLYHFSLLSKKKTPLTKGSLHIDPSHSFDGEKIAWVELNSQNKQSEILIRHLKSGKTRTLQLPAGLYRHPRWTKDNQSLLFSAQFKNENKQLYSFHLRTLCLQRLRKDLGQSYDIAVHPQGRGFAFVNDHSGQPQIYFSEDLDPIGKCL